jgi:hypothetical protein
MVFDDGIIIITTVEQKKVTGNLLNARFFLFASSWNADTAETKYTGKCAKMGII